MKVLSLWQPWASLMAIGAKKIETRGWSTPFRGPLAIAATATLKRDALRLCLTDSVFRRELTAAGILGPSDLPLGAIVAVVDLVDCVPTTHIKLRDVSAEEVYFGDYSVGRFGWMTRNVRRLPKPLPFSGGQGLTKEIPDDVIAAALAGEAVRA